MQLATEQRTVPDGKAILDVIRSAVVETLESLAAPVAPEVIEVTEPVTVLEDPPAYQNLVQEKEQLRRENQELKRQLAGLVKYERREKFIAEVLENTELSTPEDIIADHLFPN